MILIQAVCEIEEALHKIDMCINACLDTTIDYTFLSLAKDALTNQLAGIKQTLTYKMEQYEAYGEPLDEVGLEEIRASIEEIGYDQVRLLFGDNVDTVLSEAAAEEAIYRV